MRKIKTTAALAGTIMLTMALAAPPALGETAPPEQTPTEEEWKQLQEELTRLEPRPGEALAFAASSREHVFSGSGLLILEDLRSEKGWQAKSGSWATDSYRMIDIASFFYQGDTGVFRVRAGVQACNSTCAAARTKTGWATVFAPMGSDQPNASRAIKIPTKSEYLSQAYYARSIPVVEAQESVYYASISTDSTLIETAMPDGSTIYAGSYFDGDRNTTVSFSFTIKSGEVTKATESAAAESGAYGVSAFRLSYRSSSVLVNDSTRIPAAPDTGALDSSAAFLQGPLARATKELGAGTANELNKLAKKLKVKPTQAWILEHIDEAASDAARAVPVTLINFRAGAHPLVEAGESKVLLEYAGDNVPELPQGANRAMSMTLLVIDGKVKATMLQDDDTFAMAQAKLRTIMNTKETK